MTIRELKENILLSIYYRYKENKSTSIVLSELCKQEKLIFDSQRQVISAAEGLKGDGFIGLALLTGDEGIITGITPTGIEYVEENLLDKKEPMTDGFSDISKIMQSSAESPVNDSREQTEKKNKRLIEKADKFAQYYITRENYKRIVDEDAAPCFGIDAVADCFAKQLDKIAVSNEASTRMLGIFGPWGRGKTYFFKRLKENLVDKKKHTLKYKIVEFNAWKYQDTPALWAYLYETVYKSASLCAKFKNYIFQTILTKNVGIYLIVLILGWLIGLCVAVLSNDSSRLFLASAKIPATAIYIFSGIAYLFIERPASARNIIRKYTSRKSYKNHLGIQNEIELNLQKLLQSIILRAKKSRMVLYVDDIDRCGYSKMNSLIESLRTILENPKIQKRLIVICSIDEKKLLKSYSQEQVAHGFTPEEALQLSREQLDKLFLFGIKLANLDLTQMLSYLKMLIKESSSEKYKINLGSEHQEVPPFSTFRNKEVLIATDASEDISELNDEKIEALFREFLISHDVSAITPRKLRIMYYQVLFAISLSAKGGGAFTDILVEAILKKSIGQNYEENIETAMSDIVEMVVPY